MAAPDERRPAGLYYIETWGCQMNVLDSDKLAGALERHGYVRVENSVDADVVLLNTCSIREKAHEKVFSELGRLKALKDRKPDLVLGVTGCVAQQEGVKIFDRAPYADIVVGTRATGSLPLLVNRLRAGDASARHSCDIEYREDSINFPYDQIRRDTAVSGKAYVTVIEGCNHRCAFCVVPETRGPEVCRDMDDVLAEVRHLAKLGVREVEFLGQTVNAYRDASGRTLGSLLRAAAEVDGIERMRFTTSHPAQMTKALIAAMADARPKLCPYLHLPVQSGSSDVLRAMRRGYDRSGYLEKIGALREAIPGLAFGTDVIVGFPTESEADFEETLTLLADVGFDSVYSFTYSPRPGTSARALGDAISGDVKMARLQRLQAFQKEIQEARNRAWVGKEVEVLVEGPDQTGVLSTGRTAEARVTNFDGPAEPGNIVRVRIQSATAFSLKGTAFPAPA